MQAVTDACQGKPFQVKSVKRSEKKRSPAPPFITSTLQQEASRKLGMTPKRTMALAQQLYEGVEITGVGAVGLITYMRTDSQRISEEGAGGSQGLYPGPLGQPVLLRRAPSLQDQVCRAGCPRSHPPQ